jgi:hypothetical protein
MIGPAIGPSHEASPLRQQLHLLRNSLNVMVNAQYCLAAVKDDDPSISDLANAFRRAAAEASATIDRIESLLRGRD